MRNDSKLKPRVCLLVRVAAGGGGGVDGADGRAGRAGGAAALRDDGGQERVHGVHYGELRGRQKRRQKGCCSHPIYTVAILLVH